MKQKNQVNFYLILNVSPQSRSEEIKKAYLKLAKNYHPDKNRGNKLAEKKIQQINEAWQVLKDPKSRKQFDKNLQEEKERKQKSVKLNSARLNPYVAPRKEKAINLQVPLRITLEDLCQSKFKKVNYFKPINGKKIKQSFEIQIPLGAKQGTKLYFKGKGGAEGQKLFGDLYVKLQIIEHKLFKIDGKSDLFLERPISFMEAIEKESIEIPSPFGIVSFKKTSPLKNKQLLKIKGQGLAKNVTGDRGDLFVRILIDYPLKNRAKIQKEMEGLSLEKQKLYLKKIKNPLLVFPKVLRFQKKMRELKKEYLK